MTRIYNFDITTITDDMVRDFAKKVGLNVRDAREMLIEIMDEDACWQDEE